MPFPKISACVVCDFARDETRGKLTLAGFAGVTPNVTLYVDDFGKPVPITFVLHGGQGPGHGVIAFRLSFEKTGQIVAEIPSQSADISAGKHFLAAFGVVAVFPGPGRYKLSATVDGSETFSTAIHFIQGPVPA